MDKLYRDRDWLHDQYVAKGKTTYTIGKEIGVDRTTISNWLKKYDIHIRGPLNPVRDKISKEWLYRRYIDDNIGVRKLAEMFKVDRDTIYQWLRHYNIRIRSNAEAQHESRKNTVNITSDLLDILSGELLGDGSLKKTRGGWSSSYCHTSQYSGYVEWLSSKFMSLGLSQSGRIVHRKDNCWDYQTLSYEELVVLREKWYPHGIKIVPKDLVLNETIVRHWAIGDGVIAHPKVGRPHFILCTNSFDKDSMSVLIEQLSLLGIRATVRNSDNTIYIRKDSTEKFISYISPCPSEIESMYGYKFSYDGSIRYKKHPKEGDSKCASKTVC